MRFYKYCKIMPNLKICRCFVYFDGLLVRHLNNSLLVMNLKLQTNTRTDKQTNKTLDFYFILTYSECSCFI